MTDDRLDPMKIRKDFELIRDFKERGKKLEFVGFSDKLRGIDTRANRTLRALKNLEDGRSLTEQIDNVCEVWTLMLRDAIVFLKSKDTREGRFHDAQAYGSENLAELFESLGSYERDLSPILERARDHNVHVFRTFLLGWRISDSVMEGGIDLVKCGDEGFDDIQDKGNPFVFDITKDEKMAMWCIIAFCHDLGLALENVFELNRKARNIFERIGRTSMKELQFGLTPMFTEICMDVLNVLSSDLVPAEMKGSEGAAEAEKEKTSKFSLHLQSKYIRKFMNAFDRYDHGVLSCFILMKNLIYFLETDYQRDTVKNLGPEDARQFLIRSTILRAIASHNCETIYHIEMSFPFYLVLVDEMQEWDRPRPYMFRQGNVLNAELVINSFEPKEIDFRIAFRRETSGVDEGISHREVFDYVKKKFYKFIKILRCAVDARKELVFRFSVADEIEEQVGTYSLIHKSPNVADIEVNWPDQKVWWNEFKSQAKEYEDKIALGKK